MESSDDVLVVAIDTVYAVGDWRGLKLLAVKLAATGAQALCSLLRSDVALRLGHHLVADLELTNGGTSQEGRVEMDVEMAGLDLVDCACERSLVKTHACILVSYVRCKIKCLSWLTIRELGLEEVVVPPRDLSNAVCQLRSLFFGEVDQ